MRPLVAVLKDGDLATVQEVELPMEKFPDMIELEVPSPNKGYFIRQFFRIGVTDRRAFYREGTSYRISG